MSNTGDGIWEKALGQQIEQNVPSSTINNYKYHHKINRLEVRNYMFSHPADKINRESLWDFFGPNIFEPNIDGLYFAHYLFLDDYDLDKIYLALDASFNFVGPNTGEINTGINYFQQFLLYYSRLVLFNEEAFCYLTNDFTIALFELGIKYGMNPNYRDLNNDTILNYIIIAIRNFDDLKEILEALEDKDINASLLNNLGRGIETYLGILIAIHYSYYSLTTEKVPYLSVGNFEYYKDYKSQMDYDKLLKIRESFEKISKDNLIKRFELIKRSEVFDGGLHGFDTLSDVIELYEKLMENSEDFLDEIDTKSSSENFLKLIKKT